VVGHGGSYLLVLSIRTALRSRAAQTIFATSRPLSLAALDQRTRCASVTLTVMSFVFFIYIPYIKQSIDATQKYRLR